MTENRIKYQGNKKAEEAQEFIELLQTLTHEEKAQVKGIMVGIQLSRDHLTTRSA